MYLPPVIYSARAVNVRVGADPAIFKRSKRNAARAKVRGFRKKVGVNQDADR